MKNQSINIEEYYTKYGPMVLRRCRSILRDEDTAYDAMKEVFITIIMQVDSIKGQFPSSYIYRIATNTCLNIISDGGTNSVSPDVVVIVNSADIEE